MFVTGTKLTANNNKKMILGALEVRAELTVRNVRVGCRDLVYSESGSNMSANTIVVLILNSTK